MSVGWAIAVDEKPRTSTKALLVVLSPKAL